MKGFKQMKRRVRKILSVGIAACLCCVCLIGCSVKDKDGNIVPVIPINTHKISFVTNGGNAVEPKYVEVLTSVPTTSRQDYLFDGWYFDKTLNNQVAFPLEVKYDLTLYAKWLKLTDQTGCTGCELKMWSGYSLSATYAITPSGFELDKLAAKNYRMRITVGYSVYYKRDYTLPIGYAGAPKYEVGVLNESLRGVMDENVPATLNSERKSLVYTSDLVDLIDEKLVLKFSTDNIQNIVYFDNIVVRYVCYKR